MTTPDELYRTRETAFNATADTHARTEAHLSHARLLTFLAAFGAGVVGEVRASAGWWGVAGALVVVYIVLVAWHRRVRRAERWHRTLAQVSRLGLLRLARAWNELPFLAPPPGDLRAHPYADDLDVFGKPGLTQLLSPAATPAGRTAVRRWFLEPATPVVLHERQRNVMTLAPALEWRDQLVALGMQTARVPHSEIESFLAWAESEPWLLNRAGLLWIARLLPVATVLLAFAQFAGYTQNAFWSIPVIVGLVLSFMYAARIHAVYDRAFARAGLLQHFPQILEHVAAVPGDTPGLDDLRYRLGQTTADARPAHEELKRLTRIMEFSELRYSGMMYMPVQLLTMWDFHVLHRLEKWQRTAGANARGWINAAGEVDATAALAAVAHDHPDWCMPVVDVRADRIRAESIGHPMLPADRCVRNDVEVGPRSTLLLVTGSNMSGKSTLLRALGCNVLLAQAGAPVCARSLSMPPLDVYTSGRIRDSLTEGVSLFLAELQRMRSVVEAARAPGSRTLFYLLDEMLHGTNTAERRIAARTVIEHLLEQNTIGVVTTHDLSLAEEESIAAHAVLAHFTETVSRDHGVIRMDFDYTLRPGLATSTNALALLEIVGLHRE